MKSILYFTFALFLGACGTKKQPVTTATPKDTTPVVQKPTREDTLKALALDPNDERYLHDYATTIETKEDGTQIITKKIVPRKTEAEILEERKKNPIPIINNSSDADGGPDRVSPSEGKKAFMLKYYASEEFQRDSLGVVNDFFNISKENGWSKEETLKQIENYIKRCKSKYTKL